MTAQTRSLWNPALLRPATIDACSQARSAGDAEEPGDVRRRSRRRADDDPAGAGHRRWPSRGRLRAADHPVAVGDRAVRQLRRGDGRGARQGAGRHAAPDPDADGRQPARRRPDRDGARGVAAAGRRRRGRGGGVHPVRRRDHRGRRVGRRVGDHRRVGAGDPRGRRRSIGGDGRHARAVGSHRRADHRRAWPDLPRSDDRAGRGRRAPEDAERDRPEHPAGRPDDRVPDRRRHAAAVRGLFRVRRSRCSCWCRCWSA